MTMITGTVNRLAVHCDGTVTVITVILVSFCILSIIFKRCKNLKHGSRRIFSLCCTVIERRTGITVHCLPVFFNRIRIKVRFRNHCDDLTRLRFHRNHCAVKTAKCLISSLLGIRIKGCYHRITLRLVVRKIRSHLL